MERLQRSWALAGSSWAVLREHTALTLLPVLSVAATAACAAPFFLASVWVVVAGSGRAAGSGGWSVPVVAAGWGLLVVGYLVGAYVAVFFQTALVLGAHEHLAGGRPGVRAVLAAALARNRRILPWALLSATVSVVLRGGQRGGPLARLATGAAGLGWALVTFLAMPILVVEDVGVREAVARSTATLRSTWGENAAGVVGIGVASGVATLAGLLVAGPAMALGAWTATSWIVVSGAALLVVWAVLVAIVSSALSGVYRAALYRFAVLGEEPAGYRRDQFEGGGVSGATGVR